MNEIDGLIAPTIDSSVGAFHCPHCGAFAQQLVVKLGAVPQEPTIYSGAPMTSIKEMIIRECCVCNELCFFRKNGSLVYPTTDAGIPLPHKDMPRGIQRHYLEARLIAAASPRGAGAIIRLERIRIVLSPRRSVAGELVSPS